MTYSMQRLWLAGTAILVLAACGGEKKEEAAPAAAAPASNADIKPARDGKVIEVELYSNETGNFFKPNEITAKTGDVIKFELKSGVHNVNFLADSNPGKSGLPSPSEMLQLPDQEYRVYVGWAPGKYYFQCDPHALLGMRGHVTVK
ncbi:MAG TPA: plastocyanin/azurin family copper-binding protein [Gemmatimonadaceae bacterium]